jgi:predicted transcriptional regulator of viral defense system
MKLLDIQERLKKAGLQVFTTAEFKRVTGLSWIGTRKFLLRYTRLGLFWQLKRGYYAFREPTLHPWFVANKLYSPSYISLDSALSYYGVIPESIYAVTSVTTRITREYKACERLFLFHTIKKRAYTGCRPISIEGKTILVAELEKALADTLYFVHLGRRQLNERIIWQKISKKKLFYYLKAFGQKKLLSWSKDVIARSI